ncbi:MAG: oligosaccharide flippase family protein [Lachnospiraceae bacterium]|nr:oligosaccharide flippase family protein [Lachnospiraceae bacterium]
MSDNFNKNRLAKNTILLYVRMLFTMWLNLYTTRLTLANLGVEDMGVYGVVGSVVSMFAVFSGGITNAVQRFLTYEIGRSDGNPNRVFCSCLNVIFILSFVIFLMLEVGGVWFLNNHVNLPAGSLDAAQWVFQLSVLTCLINLISIPYNALIVAHEKMDAFAVISILQVVLTCASAYCLSMFEDGRLLIYAVLMASISILIRIIYQIYCHRKFAEARYQMIIDRGQIKQISKFAGVSSASGILQVISTQGFIIVINLIFGVALNAVYTIAGQLKNSVLSFAQNLQRAIAPQIIKTYANGEEETHKKLVYAGSKFQVFLIYFIMIPFLFRTEYIMRLWLGEVPPYAVTFAQCNMFLSLTYASFETIRTSVYATGNITRFMVWPEVIYLLTLPIGYYTGLITNNPNALMVSTIVYDIFVCTVRVWLATKVSIICKRELFRLVLLPCLLVFVVSFAVCYVHNTYINYTLIGLLEFLVLTTVSICSVIIAVGLSKAEKELVLKIMKSRMLWKKSVK